MGGPIPIAGYPSMAEAVLSLTAHGYKPRHVAEVLNRHLEPGVPELTGDRVSGILSSARRSGRARRPSESLSRTVVMPRDVLDRLQPEAEARGKTVNALVREIVAAVADDGLVAAVLDDDGGAE